MYFRREMELDGGIIGPLRIQEPFALRQVDNVAILVLGDIRMFETGELLQLFGVRTGDPAGLIER